MNLIHCGTYAEILDSLITIRRCPAGDEAAARSITSHESHVVDVKDKEKKKGKGKEGSRKVRILLWLDSYIINNNFYLNTVGIIASACGVVYP